jgi:hypothetical protein
MLNGTWQGWLASVWPEISRQIIFSASRVLRWNFLAMKGGQWIETPLPPVVPYCAQIVPVKVKYFQC